MVEARRFGDDPEGFLFEYIYVVLNAGMREQVARKIYDRIVKAVVDGVPVASVFGNRRKVAAILLMMMDYRKVFRGLIAAGDKLGYLEGLPFIGRVTKYHLARNLGLDYAKPDRHLSRLASRYGTDVQSFCEGISRQSGDRVGTVDVVLWRAANLGIIKKGDGSYES